MTIIKNKNNNIAFIDKTLAKAAQKFENGRLTQAEAQRLGLTITTR